MSELREQIEAAVRTINKACSTTPAVAIILGTGLDGLGEHMTVRSRMSYDSIPHFPHPTGPAHAGEFLVGELAGKPVAAFSGRFHAYEGYSLKQVTFPVRVAKALGAEILVVSNAAGGLNPEFAPGDLMLITDHINLMGDNPLIGPNDDTLGPRFPDMSQPYSPELIELAESVALAKGIKMEKGVYLACTGPSLETRAEYRFMRAIGADAVGMSTVPEVIVAAHAGLEVLGFSVITDMCLPDALEAADIERIIETAEAAEPRLTEIVVGTIERLKV